MNQRGLSLLETMLSLFLISSLMFFFIELLSLQQRGFEQVKQKVTEIYLALGIYQEFNRLASDLRPFFCAMPGLADYQENHQSYQVAGIHILKLFFKENRQHLQLYVSTGDLLPMTNKNNLYVANCQESQYFLTNFKLGFIFQAFSCLANKLILLEKIPKTLSSPFFLMPIQYKEYVIDANKLYLHAKGVPQVLYSGFSRFAIRLQANGLNIMLKLPHLGTLAWEAKFCGC